MRHKGRLRLHKICLTKIIMIHRFNVDFIMKLNYFKYLYEAFFFISLKKSEHEIKIISIMYFIINKTLKVKIL